MSDTARIIHDTIYVHSSDAMQIAEQAHNFYSDAWDKLITFTVGLLGLVGVAAPVLLNYYQKRQLNLNKGELRAEINKDLERVTEDVSSKLNSEIKNVDRRVNAAISSLNGLILLNDNQPARAFVHFIISIRYAVLCKEYANVNNMIKSAQIALSITTKGDLDREWKTEGHSGDDIESYLDKSISADKDSIVSSNIRKLKAEFQNLK